MCALQSTWPRNFSVILLPCCGGYRYTHKIRTKKQSSLAKFTFRRHLLFSKIFSGSIPGLKEFFTEHNLSKGPGFFIPLSFIIRHVSVKLAMYSCRRNGVATFLLLSHLVATAAIQSGPVNASDFPGHHSGSRLAYFRWRAWLLSRPAVVQKVPPVPKMAEAKTSGGLDVRVKMIPLHVLNVDEAHQTVQAAARLQFRWVHPALAVNSNLAQVFTDGNSSLMPYSVTVPSKVLWLPALVAVEGVSVLEIMQDINELEVQRDGAITVTLPSVLTFMCRFDMTGYPFDQHDCSVTVMDTSFSVNVHPPGTPWDRSIEERFGVAGEWDLIDVTEKSLVYPLTGQIYAQFILHLRRKTTFYSVILITPLVLTSYLNALVFLLPPDLVDKASYLVTLTISMSVFSSFFKDNMPRGLDSMPRIFLLHIFILAESLFTLVMSVVVLKKYKTEQCQPETEGTAASGVWDVRENNVSPVPRVENKAKGVSIGNLTAAHLDTVFCVIALTGNTVGIAVILSGFM